MKQNNSETFSSFLNLIKINVINQNGNDLFCSLIFGEIWKHFLFVCFSPKTLKLVKKKDSLEWVIKRTKVIGLKIFQLFVCVTFFSGRWKIEKKKCQNVTLKVQRPWQYLCLFIFNFFWCSLPIFGPFQFSFFWNLRTMKTFPLPLTKYWKMCF